MKTCFLFLTLFWLLLLPEGGLAQSLEKQGKIHGESYVNLRSGPGLRHPPKAVLREGDVVLIEGETRGWYLVSLADGKRGHVAKRLVQLSGYARAEATPDEREITSAAEPAAQFGEGEALKGRPLPIVKVLEGKEGEILRWLAVGLCIFILGWICGGNYYLHRDRVRRSKIHF